MIKKDNILNFIFYVLYFLVLLYFMGNRVVFLYKLRFYIYKLLPFLLFSLIIIQSNKYKFKSILFIFFSLILSILSYIISDCSDLFLTVLFIIAAKNICFRDFVKKDLNIKFLILLFVILCSFLGLTDQMISYRNGVPRYPLGFGHPNALGGILFSLCIDIFIIYYPSFKIKHFLIFIFSLFVTAFVCDSRSAMMGILLLLFFYIFFKIKKNIKTTYFKQFLISFLPVFFLIISLFSIHLYLNSNQIALTLDELMSGRIKYAAEFYEYYDITLFGNFFENFGNIKETAYLSMLDNAYINILLRFGIFLTFIFFIGFIKTISINYLKRNWGILISIIVVLIYGLMENYIWFVIYNPLLLYFSNILYFKE